MEELDSFTFKQINVNQRNLSMKIKFFGGVGLALMLLQSNYSSAQTPNDALMMSARQACVLASYEFGKFNQYWEGDLLRDNQTIATVHRNTALPMVAVGIFDELNFYIGTPHVSTHSTYPNGGKFAGAQGLQDIYLGFKYRILNKEMENGNTFSALATVGFSAPMTNYLSDYLPYSLGFGAPELSYRGILQYEFEKGIYVRGAAAYLWRGYTEAERTYYYNNGSYYTAWMDVPSAWNFEAILGAWLLKKSLKVELSYVGLKSTSGDDIRPYNAPQPTNKVQWDRIGLSAQYFVPQVKGLGILAYHTRVVNGTNAAKINSFGVGITYQFNYLKSKN